MPTLKQLTCSVEWIDSGEPLPEYQTTYTDGYVECLIAVPSDPRPFAIRLRSSGYVAPGLSMFVYMDGVYQCNRNRQNLKFPDDGSSKPKIEINFRVRQKEESLKTGGFRGKEWKFEKVKIVSEPDIEASERAPHNGEYVGTIEVVVLRCFSSYGWTESLKSAKTLVNGKTSSFSHEVSENDDLSTGGTMNGSSERKPKHKSGPRPQVFGTDGPLDDRGSPVSPMEGPNKDSRDWKKPLSPTVDSVWDKPSSSKEEPKSGPITATGPKSGTYYPVAESSKSNQAGSQRGPSTQLRSPTGQQIPPALQLRGGGPGSYSASSHHGSARGSPVVVNVYNGIGTVPPLTKGPPPPRDWMTEGKAQDAAKSSRKPAAKFDPWLDAPGFDPSRDADVNKGNPDPKDKVDSWNTGGQDMPGGWGASNDQRNDNAGRGASGDKPEDNSAAWDNAGNASDWDKPSDDAGKDENGWNTSNGKGKEKVGDGWGNDSEEKKDEDTGNDEWGNDNNDTQKSDSWGNIETKDTQQGNDWNANNGDTNQQNDTWNTDNAEPVAEASTAGGQDKDKTDKFQKGPKSPGNKKKGKGPKGPKGPKGTKAGSVGKASSAKLQAASKKPKAQSPTRDSLKSAMKKTSEAPPGSLAASKKSSVQPGEWSPRLGPARNSPKPGEPSASQAQPMFSSLFETPRSKAYWSSWNEPPAQQKPPNEAPRSLPAEEEPLYSIPAEVARRNTMSHQVRPGRPISYKHKVSIPRYMDSHEDPYAVFVFQYRDKEVIEQMFNITIAAPKVDEKARLASLSKEELVEEVLKTKEKLSWQGTLQGNSGGSPSSSDKATFESNPNGIAVGPNAGVLSERLSKLDSSKEDTPKMVGAWVDETPAAEANGKGYGNENDASGAWGGDENKNENGGGDIWGCNDNNGNGNGEASTKADENGDGGGDWGNYETSGADAKTEEEKKDDDTGANDWGTTDEKKDENADGNESGKKVNNGADEHKDNSWIESGFGAFGDWPENEEEKKEKVNGNGNGNGNGNDNGGGGDSWGDNAGGGGGGW